MKRTATFALDLARTVVSHPKWFIGQAVRQLAEIRARANGRFKYGLRELNHHHLDPRLPRLAVDLGGASWVDNYKALIVSRFCRLLQPTRVLEIGTFKGGMTFHIARNTPESCQIFTLDLPRELLDRDMTEGMVKSDVELAAMNASRVGEEWQGKPEAKKITQLWGDSLHFDFSPLAPFQLIYVDGSHANPWVQKDTDNAFRFLDETGVILWDDCYWADVLSTLGEHAHDRPIYLFEDGNTAGYFQVNGKAVAR